MARVEIKAPREQASSFALYRTSAGGDESIVVRRKVGEPTDYLHAKSRKLARQRENFTLASQHYSHLSPSQKAITRYQIEEVEYQKSHGQTDTRLLMGRQLFISKEMHSLETTQKQLVLPHELCIMLVDDTMTPLAGTLLLYDYVDDQWCELKGDEIGTGNWLFSQVPRGQFAYRPFGESAGYFDPQFPATQWMTEDEILVYRYHILYGGIPVLEYVGAVTSGFSCIEGRRAAQTFTLSAPASIQGVTLKASLFDPTYDGTLFINIEETTGGIPNGVILSQGSTRVTHLTSAWEGITTWLTSVHLQSNVRYAVVASIIMDKPYPFTESLRVGLLSKWYPYRPEAGLRSFQSSGMEWYPFPHGYCFWLTLLAKPS